jgi:hypothetical protein
VGVDYTERLRCLAINDARFAEGGIHDARFAEGVGRDLASQDLNPKTLALVRLAALVAVGGAVPSYGAQADAAVSAGATASEIVDVLNWRCCGKRTADLRSRGSSGASAGRGAVEAPPGSGVHRRSLPAARPR